MKKEDFIKQFVRNIQKLRIQEGISLAELGSRSHVPLWMLEELEQGTLPKEMMVTDALRLAMVFHCPVHELFR
mgnify:CR=1 FL=1